MRSALTIIVLMFLHTTAIAANMSSPVGLWKTIDDVTHKPKSLFRITESKGILYGTVVKTFPSENYVNGICVKCEGPYHNKRLEGVTLMRGLTAESDNPGNWSGGKITDPLNGKTYRCAIKLINNGRSLNVRGYVGIQLLGRSQEWQRVE
ncbi:MAG TPA: DUF2147 domain-containing protein [Gammaproteobacteria bacterium]|nr:DUF2147 domain-containing protein [Gammaproteobacteria bacterium]